MKWARHHAFGVVVALDPSWLFGWHSLPALLAVGIAAIALALFRSRARREAHAKPVAGAWRDLD